MRHPIFLLFLAASWGCRSEQELRIHTGTPDTGGMTPLDADGDGYSEEEDCDDHNALVNPGAGEICDGLDNNCDGAIDEDVGEIWYTDLDEDGWGNSEDTFYSCGGEPFSAPVGGDCDDNDPDTYPGAPERCDDIDNDCDGEIDEDLLEVWYADVDGDGHGNPDVTLESCDPDSGYVADATDCDDDNAAISPVASEICDGVDNDCDSEIDEDDAVDATTFYADSDADGFGDAGSTTTACFPPSGFVDDDSDCNDTDADIHPDAEEICDGLDNNCDGWIDDDDPSLTDPTTFYRDADGDGYGSADHATEACDQPSGYVTDATDCDDLDASAYPGGIEICDGVDNDCDGSIDPDTSTDADTWYADNDSDGFGDAAASTLSCEEPSGFVADDTDCDDADSAQYPGADEYCNGEDDDCDGSIDEEGALDATTYWADADGDGFGDATSTIEACEQPSDYVTDTTDCDDNNADANPDAVEVCDGADNDCDGSIDPTDTWWDTSWPYRIQVQLTASGYDIDGPPVALDVDFDASLATLGESGSFSSESLRVVLQDCSLGQPELPSQFLDEVWGLFEKQDHTDTAGDAAGTVVFLYDEDGDYSSLETLAAGDTAEIALYFETSGTDPGYTTSLTATTSQLANFRTEANFDSSAGGLLDTLYIDNSPSVMSQTDSCCGNGFYTTSWYETPMYTSATVTLLEDGPVLALLESTGSVGGYDFTYQYWLFAGRTELWSKTHHVTTTSITFDHPSDFVYGVRPWESRQDAISSGATFTTDTNYTYTDVSNGTWGVSFGYHQPPVYPDYIYNYDPYFIIIGGDYAPSGSGTSFVLPSGVHVIDHPVMLVRPHTGSFSGDEESEFYGLLEGVSVYQYLPDSL